LLSNEFSLDIDWGFAPDPTGGAYSAPQTHSWFQRGGRRGMEGREGKSLGEGEEGRGKGEWKREGKRAEWGAITPWLLGDRRSRV